MYRESGGRGRRSFLRRSTMGRATLRQKRRLMSHGGEREFSGGVLFVTKGFPAGTLTVLSFQAKDMPVELYLIFFICTIHILLAPSFYSARVRVVLKRGMF